MKQIAVLLVALGVVAGCSKANVEEASREFNQLPEAVRETTREHMPNAEVTSVTREAQNGVNVYEIGFRDKERHPAITVAEDGRIVKYERPIARGGALDNEAPARSGGGGSDISALPVEVQKAIRANTPRAEVVSIKRDEEDGRRIYIIEFAGHERNPSIRVTEDGALVRD